ncbi:hypothetical protein B9Q01_09260 [Candidatus Marsarchaeota G1 archaeon OSP_D]|uniref:Alpha-galactosidase NEW3 domain-containing protein n=1 Tax=Candidatus Marsarchaeota G1 archaeon OSP_D TaxID=1978155 RepID=A0A2R6A6R8_9ARCH|nr:MAG: hypothetical protein B9Q01_09260 [Candidatus Marsarchaeota G1 archaeon OSP_D]
MLFFMLKAFTLSLLLALSLLPLSSCFVLPSQPTFELVALWGSPQSPVLAAPGSVSLPLYVSVTNLGPVTAYDFKATLKATNPLQPVKGESQNLSVELPALPAGDSASLVGYFNVSPSVQAGVYNESVFLEYKLGNQSFSQTMQVQVPILGEPNIELAGFSYTPIRIYPGYPYAQLDVYLVNSGTATASDVSVNLNTSYPAYPAYNGSTQELIGYLPTGQVAKLSFLIALYNTTKALNTSFVLSVRYNEAQYKRFSIPFQEYPKAVIQVVDVYEPTIRVGDSADYVTITVKNVGGAAAQFLTFTMLVSNVFSPSIPSSENPLLALQLVNASVGTLEPGEEANITYVIQVNPNIQSGVYPLTLVATWRQAGSSAPFVQEISLPIHVQKSVLGQVEQSLTSVTTNPLFVFETLLVVVLIVLIAVIAVRLRRKG